MTRLVSAGYPEQTRPDLAGPTINEVFVANRHAVNSSQPIRTLASTTQDGRPRHTKVCTEANRGDSAAAQAPSRNASPCSTPAAETCAAWVKVDSLRVDVMEPGEL